MRVAIALLTLYLVWGSTYLAIHWVVVAGWPLLLTAAIRFVIAGVMFLMIARVQGPLVAHRGGWLELRHATVTAALMFVVSNGLVMWGQTRVESGLAALLVALTPVWITLLEGATGTRPDRWQLGGVAVGLAGVAILADPRTSTIDPLGTIALLSASMAWSLGTMWTKYSKTVASPFEGAGWQLLAASVMLFVIAGVRGEQLPIIDAWRPVLAFLWLLFAGSLAGYGAFTWLLRNSTPAITTTYAYVNPIIAAGLGWAFADETIGWRSAIAATLVLSGVAAITTSRSLRPT